jgi:hypothetical protein
MTNETIAIVVISEKNVMVEFYLISLSAIPLNNHGAVTYQTIWQAENRPPNCRSI